MEKGIPLFPLYSPNQFSIFVSEIIEAATQGKKFKTILHSHEQFTFGISELGFIFEEMINTLDLANFFSFFI